MKKLFKKYKRIISSRRDLGRNFKNSFSCYDTFTYYLAHYTKR